MAMGKWIVSRGPMSNVGELLDIRGQRSAVIQRTKYWHEPGAKIQVRDDASSAGNKSQKITLRNRSQIQSTSDFKQVAFILNYNSGSFNDSYAIFFTTELLILFC